MACWLCNLNFPAVAWTSNSNGSFQGCLTWGESPLKYGFFASSGSIAFQSQSNVYCSKLPWRSPKKSEKTLFKLWVTKNGFYGTTACLWRRLWELEIQTKITRFCREIANFMKNNSKQIYSLAIKRVLSNFLFRKCVLNLKIDPARISEEARTLRSAQESTSCV